MRIIRYLLGHKAAMALATLLLVALVATDLALPTLTSDIVDVGIQQAGIEHVATDRMSAATHDAIADRQPSCSPKATRPTATPTS